MNGFPVVFANPWGALALLGLPVVIAIHCLQQKSRVLRISTLFLLERLAPDSREGRRFTWLRSSLPFWLQILCVLTVTWLLLDPRWMRIDAVQRVVLVLDSSLSLRAFTGDISAQTSPRLQSLAALAPRTYWTVMETDPSRPTLYEGTDLAALEQKLQAWTPSLPAHDPTHALELARSLAVGDALVIFVTDRPHEVPSGVDLLAIGEPIENCGLIGSRLTGEGDDLEWQVVVQNYGKQTAHRFWWIDLAGQKTERQSLDLEPGHPQILKGKFPPGLDRLEVCLDGDRFSVDDCMPIVRPQPKHLSVSSQGDPATSDLFARLIQTIPSLITAPSGPSTDVTFLALAPGAVIPSDLSASLVFFSKAAPHEVLQGGPFTAEEDPLNQDLNWQGLVLPIGAPASPKPGDHVLLWKDHFPIIYLRALPQDRKQLVFNFNFPSSNASRLPAFVLLVSRFIESVRMEKQGPETGNVELAESLTIAAHDHGGPVILHPPHGPDVSVPARALVQLRAPATPGFFTVTQDHEVLFTGAAQYADARESDFSSAVSIDTLAAKRGKLVDLHARAETTVPLWLLLIGILLVTNWRASAPRPT